MPVTILRRPIVTTTADEVLNDTAFNVNWTNQGGAGEAWTLGATDLSVPLDNAFSERVRRPLNFTSGETYDINLLFTLSDVAGIEVRVYLGGTQLVDFGTFTTGTPFNETRSVIASSNYTYFEIEADTSLQNIQPVLITISDVIVDEGVTATFKFNSIALPTIYEMERRDFTWNQINDNGGDVQAQFNGINLTTSFAIGDSIYVKALAGSPYDGFTTVTAVAFSAGNTLVTVDIPYVSTSTSGFINNDSLRPGYYLQVRFYDTGDTLLTDAIQETSPTAKGNMIVDISEFAKAFLSPDFEDIAPTFTITQDDLAAKEMYIGYREVWIGSQENETSDNSNTIVVVLGAQQLPLLNGSNYGLTADRFTSVYGVLAAKLLVSPSEILIWRDWPFTISALISDSGGQGKVLRVLGDQSANTNESSSLTSDEDIMIRANIGGIDWSDYVNDTTVSLYLSLSGEPDTIESVILTGKLLDPCRNPVMILFRNSLGGDRFHLFTYNQDYGYENDNGTKVKRMILSTTGLTADQWDELNDMITYGAELKENIIEILSTTNKTKTRAYQQVYKVDQDGTLTGVVVRPTINYTMTKKVKHTFEVEIEFPEYFLP